MHGAFCVFKISAGRDLKNLTAHLNGRKLNSSFQNPQISGPSLLGMTSSTLQPYFLSGGLLWQMMIDISFICWQLLVDLERQTKFPAHIVETKLRPDLVMFSNSTKKVIMWELSVPWEENMESTHERKIAKYEPLVEQCRMNGWQAICQAVEVGCRGFNARSMSKALSSIGISGAGKRKALKNITTAAERATNWLWIRRADSWGCR